MTPDAIIQATANDGLYLGRSPSGTIKAAGNGAAMDRWLPVIKEKKAEVLAVLAQGAGTAVGGNGVNGGVSYCWWQLRYADSAPREIAYCPPASHAEVMASEPDAVSVMPYKPHRRRTDSPFSNAHETLILQWLEEIGESDTDTIKDLLKRCRTDADAREYFLSFAERVG